MKKKILTAAFICTVILTTRSEVSPYITRVLEYKPAPGQFVNTTTTAYKTGYSAEQVRAYAETLLTQRPKSGLLSLGSFGGYIVVGFDHTIANVQGEYDFKVYGNAFYSAQQVKQKNRPGGSCEPGIVMVSRDLNNNGIADDEWYELAGSEYADVNTIHNYTITYHRPDIAGADIPWSDNQGAKGFVHRNIYHQQTSYYPLWTAGDILTFSGTRLASSSVNEGTEEVPYWVLYSYPWGYADNHPNADEKSNFKIEWAVDQQGNPVDLPGIDFIKIYTGQLQESGWLGETSTEICDVEDLHPDVVLSLTEESTNIYAVNPIGEFLQLTTDESCEIILYNSLGTVVLRERISSGSHSLPTMSLTKGVYTLQVIKDGQSIKTMKLIK
ncbi:MAG: T9SS type A sorting domain-containing protein [Bacteroidales bacterium]|nr:T9SS type A sorting domain-containing protein [Bacteroidales bacterium]